MFPSSPGYATDAQLSQMARGGLPNAVNEEITRLALRRGARAVPQPQTPRSPMPMSGEDMIKDFVHRVRQENTNAANSIVPAGTPMQQPQQSHQPQPAQASGIAGYSSGGVRGFQDGGGNEPVSALDKIRTGPSVKDGYLKYPEGREADGYYSGPQPFRGPSERGINKYLVPGYMVDKMPQRENKDYRGPPQKQKPPRDPDYQKLVDLSQGRISNIYDGWSEIEGFHGKPDPSASQQPVVDPTTAGGGSAGIAALMADAPRLGAFKPSAYVAPAPYEDAKLIDLNEAGDERVTKNREKIDALARPYNEGAAELEGMSEEIKRKEIFNGMVQAGIAMMQGGGASFDPRSGDMMAIMGDGAAAYVDSLTKDRKRQQELKEKIVAYKGAANELTFNAEGQMFAQGADIAQARNQQAITENAYKHQYKGRSAEMENSFNVGQDANRLRLIIAQAEIDTAKFKASLEARLKASPGVDPELALKISAEAGKRADERFKTMMGKFEMDPDNPEAYAKRLEAAHAAARAAYSEAVSSFLDFSAGRFDYGGGIATLSQRAAERQTPGVPNIEEMEGDPPTRSITGYPYSNPRGSQKDEDVIDFDPRALSLAGR